MNGSGYLRKLVNDKRRALGIYQQPNAKCVAVELETVMRGIVPEYSAAEMRIRDGWENIVGADIAGRTTPGGIVNGVLTLYVSGAVWLAELRNNRAADLLRLINRHAGHGSVKRIEFRADGAARKMRK